VLDRRGSAGRSRSTCLRRFPDAMRGLPTRRERRALQHDAATSCASRPSMRVYPRRSRHSPTTARSANSASSRRIEGQRLIDLTEGDANHRGDYPLFRADVHVTSSSPRSRRIRHLIRLCATSARRCSCHPLGFAIDDARVRRAGLEYTRWRACASTRSFACLAGSRPRRLYALTTTREPTRCTAAKFAPDERSCLGPETSGCPRRA